MRYWCHECKSEINIGEDVASPDEGYCPVCSDWDMDEHPAVLEEIPQYETPEQYEKRTGKKLPDNAAMWYRYFREQEHAEKGWLINSLKIIRDAEPHYGGTLYYVCAQSPEPPPDDYAPEGV